MMPLAQPLPHPWHNPQLTNQTCWAVLCLSVLLHIVLALLKFPFRPHSWPFLTFQNKVYSPGLGNLNRLSQPSLLIIELPTMTMVCRAGKSDPTPPQSRQGSSVSYTWWHSVGLTCRMHVAGREMPSSQRYLRPNAPDLRCVALHWQKGLGRWN